jgi:hypothetical protein
VYAIYRTEQTESEGRYIFDRPSHFFGCNSGLPIQLLRRQLSPSSTEPYPWHVNLRDELGQAGETFLIDLKPNNQDAAGSRSLYEVLDVWGRSDHGWTPAMLRLRGLVIDGGPRIENPRDFQVEFMPEHSNIFSFLYFAGTIRDGAIHGTWRAPGASPTNSALLWPETLSYFMGEIQAR